MTKKGSLIMAELVTTTRVDDLDGTADAAPVRFGWNGVGYEIDLTPDNAYRLGEALAPYVKAARKEGRRPAAGGSAQKASRQDGPAIRAWAISNGIRVNDRGRIPVEVVAKYNAEH